MVIKMKTENSERLIDEKTDSSGETLADLPVTDEQARQAKGGGDDMPTETISFIYGQANVRPNQ
jgi:hypothetical protein